MNDYRARSAEYERRQFEPAPSMEEMEEKALERENALEDRADLEYEEWKIEHR